MAAGEGSVESRSPRLDVVIVNWNSGALLRECIAALAASSLASRLNVVVVDNASSDGSADALQHCALVAGPGTASPVYRTCGSSTVPSSGPAEPGAIHVLPDAPKDVDARDPRGHDEAKRPGFPPVREALALKVLRNPRNRGFSAACNQGAALGQAPFVLLLNPDVRVAPDTIARALAYLEEKAGVGVLGVRLLDSEGRVQRCCARAPSAARLLGQALFLDRLMPAVMPPHFLTEWDHGDTRPVDQVMGAFLIIRRDLLERLGGLDERFFLYYEDVDLCLRARRAGGEVVHFAAAQAMHRGGGSTKAVKDRRLAHHAESRIRYMAKHHGSAAAGLLALAILLVEFPLRWLHSLIRRPAGEAGGVLRAAGMLARGLWLAGGVASAAERSR
jgi:GT2 family glycosyltransferase